MSTAELIPNTGSRPAFPAGPLADAVQRTLARLDRPQRFAGRLFAGDDSLWGPDEAHRKVARNRLGWIESAIRMKPKVADIERFADEIASEGFTHAVLLGMGGSSLAPEVMRLTFGVRKGFLDLVVLDNTSPAAVRAIGAAHDPRTTLFIVSSKSGSTIEVASFEKHFYAWVAAALGDKAGRSFVAVTDPGSPLETLARDRGYRRVFGGQPDVGGRYSALTEFGMVPAALIGADLEGMMIAAEAEAVASGPAVDAAANPAVALGAWLGTLAERGRDKMTLVLGPEIAALGSWIEQLVAESTGKSGKGVVPVTGEPLAGPAGYRDDRLFVAVSVTPFAADVEAKLAALAAAGHPVIRWTLPTLAALGGEFLRWEIATATAGAVLGVDPFDEPNVTEAKDATRAALGHYLDDGGFPPRRPVALAPGLDLEAPKPTLDALRAGAAGSTDPVAWLRAHLALAGDGDYVALLAYLHRTPERQAKLDLLGARAMALTRCAVTLGWGPRFLHSTGQLHKGGANNGVFVQIVADEDDELAIPGERYGFGALRQAQAMGDYEVLARRERRVVRVHLGDDVERGLARLVEGLNA